MLKRKILPASIFLWSNKYEVITMERKRSEEKHKKHVLWIVTKDNRFL